MEAPFGLSPLEFRCGDRQVLHGPRRTPAGAGVKARRDIHAQQRAVLPEHSTAQLRGVCVLSAQSAGTLCHALLLLLFISV